MWNVKEQTKTSIVIDGVEYVRADSIKPEPLSEYSLIRADSGVYFGRIKSRNDREAVVEDCRQIYYFVVDGLNTLDIATKGVLAGSKLTCSVGAITVCDVRTVVQCTESAAKNLKEYPTWKR